MLKDRVAFEQAARWGAGLVFCMVAAGCATGFGGRSDREVVAERAQARWDELVKSDFAAAYRYISPAGRGLITSEAYASGLKKGFWKGAKVDSVRCPTAEACDVDVWIEYEHMGLKMRTPVHEKWVKERSNWWFLLAR